MTVVYTSETPQQSPAETSELRPTEQGPLPIYGFEWRRDGKLLIAYLLDSEVHTFAFSVAANAILSFIPFVVLLYTLALRVYRSPAMVNAVSDMVNYFLPSVTRQPNWLATNIELAAALSSRHGVQALSLVMILIS